MRLFRRAQPEPEVTPIRLHIGCGEQVIQGWTNIDSRALPGVDQVLDVRQGLAFSDVAAIYAEHFLEHLSFDEGLQFLRECRRALAPAGILRVSTPNLDWVYMTHYRYGRWESPDGSLLDCLQINRAFHGWGHQFLFNPAMLEAALKASGFAVVAFHRYGESDVTQLRGLERHETWEDTPELPHVIIAQASGRAKEQPLPVPPKLVEEYREAVNIR